MFKRIYQIFLAMITFGAVSCDQKVDSRHLLADPQLKENHLSAPEYFKVKFICSNGEFIVESRREWAPHGVDRFYNLVKNGYYNGVPFFRVVPNFIVQFGIHVEQSVDSAWDKMEIPDDPTIESNVRGTLSYGTRGPNTRTTHLVINYNDNSQHLDPTNSVIAKVIDGMSTVDKIYSGYGDLPVFGGSSPEPDRIKREGIQYLKREFPQLDYILNVSFIE